MSEDGGLQGPLSNATNREESVHLDSDHAEDEPDVDPSPSDSDDRKVNKTGIYPMMDLNDIIIQPI